MLTPVEYDKAKELLIDYIDKRIDIVTVWQYGEVSQPGVSDLDLIAVIKEKCEDDLSSYLRKDHLPPLTLQAMAHANLIIVPENSAEGVFYWDNIKCVDIRNGTPIQSPIAPQEYLMVAMLVDWFFERTFRVYSIKNSGNVSSQSALGLLKSYCYSVDIFNSLSNSCNKEEYLNLKIRLYVARTEWLSLSTKGQKRILNDLLEDFYRIARALHRDVFEWLTHSSPYPNWCGSDEPVFLIFPDGNTYKFTRNFEELVLSKNEHPIICLPKNLLHHYLAYTQPERGLCRKLEQAFSARFAQDLTQPLKENDSYTTFLNKRISFAADWYDSLKHHKFEYGLFKFGWFLKD